MQHPNETIRTQPNPRPARPFGTVPAQAEPSPRQPGGLVVAVVVAMILALAAIGVAAWALTKAPPKGAVGAQGPAGVAGPQGPRGLQGKTGATGKTGVAGPAGTVTSATLSRPTPLTTSPDPAVGTVLVSQLTCPSGFVLLSGGAQVTAPGSADRDVVLRSSFPTNSTTWQVVAMVIKPLGAGNQMTMRPYALCGSK